MSTKTADAEFRTTAGVHAYDLQQQDERGLDIPADEMVERVADIMGQPERKVRKWLKAGNMI